MSIEPLCDYCGVSDKTRCKTQLAADNCKFFNENQDLLNLGDYELKEDTDLDFDFGFTILETDMIENTSQTETINRLEEALLKLYNSITPFLNNLAENPEVPTIHWPNRAEKIEEFKLKLSKILEDVNLI